MSTAPFTTEQYRQAFLGLGPRVSEAQRRMLAAHARSRARLLDVESLARAAGFSSPNYTYAHYGRLGHDVARAIGARRQERVWTRVLGLDSRNRAGLVQWRLYAEVAAAVRAVGWSGHLVRPDPLAEARAAASTLRGLTPTVREALIEARLGQGAFRQALVSRWGGCAVTGCTVLEALRASHIKPWHASSNRERLDPDNGLLLMATLDALFDAGLISFSDSGAILISSTIPAAARSILGLRPSLHLRHVGPRTASYLAWHRHKVFAGAG